MRISTISTFALALVGAVALSPDARSERSASIARVYDYLPAPGQFVNTLPAIADGATHQDAVQAANEALTGGSMITLGAYGGYVVFGWDHPVVNLPGQYDFKVLGNAFSGSNEAGIIMVSVDINANGLPDDTWYEIAGSEYNADGTMHQYTCTYTCPDDPSTQDYTWESNDSANSTGAVKRNNFHKQSYWPAWVNDKTMTFSGTRLRNYAVLNGNIWTLPAFEFGYADNLPNTSEPGINLDWAVDSEGKPVQLTHIDFVKVYTGSQQYCGNIGEISTEVSGATDLHPDATMPLGIATFEEVPLQPESWWSHAEGEEDDALIKGSVTSGSMMFNNQYMPDYDSWMFWAVSNTTSTDFSMANYLVDQFNSAAGGGHESENFGVMFGDANMGITKVDVLGGVDAVIPGVYITNAAWVADAIENGDGQTPGAFGQGDWFKLTVMGLDKAILEDTSVTDAKKTSDKTVDIYLADYRSTDPAEWYYLKDWRWFDLSELGAVSQLRFVYTSSRNNSWGMTTPAYACFDDFGATKPASGLNNVIDGSQDESISIDGLTVSAQNSVSLILYGLTGSKVTQGTDSVTAPMAGTYIVTVVTPTGNLTRKVRLY